MMSSPQDAGQAGGGAPAAVDASQPGSGSNAAKIPVSVADLVSRTLMLGVGAAALTIDKAQSVVDELVKRGQMTNDEARQTVASLAERSKNEARSTARSLESTLKSTYRELGLATRSELEDLDFRLRQVEHRLSLAERRLDDRPSSEPEA
jgi:polyhydroxyalkanoate synthesis regulator phasin